MAFGDTGIQVLRADKSNAQHSNFNVKLLTLDYRVEHQGAAGGLKIEPLKLIVERFVFITRGSRSVGGRRMSKKSNVQRSTFNAKLSTSDCRVVIPSLGGRKV